MPNYPGSLDDDISLFLAVNNARTRLTSSITISDLTIPVVTTSGFPNQGFVTILTNPDDITEAEAIAYTGVTDTSFSGTLRGAGGTPIFAHGTGNNVDLTVMAEHHNELKDAVIELEKILGVSGSLNFVPKDAQGNAVVSGTLTAEKLFDAGWVAVSGSLVVCGEARFKDDVLFEQDVNISGCLQVGGPDISADPGFYFTSDETVTDTTLDGSTVIMESTEVPSAGKHLIMFRANAGGRSGETDDPELVARYNGVDMALTVGDEKGTNQGTWSAADLAGYKIIDANGVSKPEIRLRNNGGGSANFQYGRLGLLSIPLDEMGLVENTDYFFSTGSDTIQNSGITNNYTLYTDSTLNFTVTKPGQYLMIGYAETSSSIFSDVQFRLNGSNRAAKMENTGNRYQGHQFLRVVTLSAGANSADARFDNNSAFNATTNGRRGRVAFIYMGFFNQHQSIRSTSGLVNTSNAFVTYTPVTQNFQPQVQSQVLLLAQTQHVTADVDSATTWQFKNETTGDTYMVDAGSRIYAVNPTFGIPSPSLARGTMMFHLLEDQSADYEWRMETREPTGQGDNQTVEEVFFMQWSNALPAGPPVIDYTLIKEDKISTPSICVDNIDINFDAGVSGTLTVRQGITTATGTFTEELNAPGNAFLHDTTIDWLTVTGTIEAGGAACLQDVDIKGDLTVSGTAKFGQAAPVAVYSDVIFASNDVEQTNPNLGTIDSGCETAALANGVEYLVIYNCNSGNSSLTSKTDVECLFGATKIGGHDGLKSNLGSGIGSNHYNDSFTSGVFKVTGNGSSTVKFTFDTNGNTAYIGAQSIVCVPLDQFTQDSDYYYGETANNDTNVITNAPIQDPPNTALLSSTFTGMAAGDYIFMWSSEQKSSNFTGRAWSARLQVDGTTVGASRYARNGDNSSNDIYNFSAAHVVNVPTGGNITCEILVSSLIAGEADFRRGRIFAIQTSLFNQVVSTTDSTGFTTNSTSYQDFTGLTSTITPSGPDTPIIILSSATTYTQNSDSSALHAIRNETDAVDYRDDSGERNTAVGGTGHASVRLSSIFMTHFEERTALTEYRHQLRTPIAGDVSVGRNDDDTGGELSEMILWEFTPVAPFIPITQTCIDDDEILTGTMIADTVTARQSLTVSGLAVHAGDPLSLSNLVVTDEACLWDVDVKNNLTVSGTAKFGQDNTPPSANGDVIFVSQDTEQTTASLTFVDANCETAPLLNGVEYLIIYAGNFGIDTESISVESQTLLGSTRIGRSGFAASALGTFGNNANNASYCHGIYRATGNGTDTVKFQFRVVSGTQTAYADAMSIICIPLDAYVQNTDYFFVETTNSDSAVVSNAAVIDPPTTVMLSNTFTSMDAGDWLFICSAEGNVSAGTTRGAVINFQVASTTIGTSRYTFQGRSFGNLTWNSVAVANMVNVAGGNTDVDILVASTQSAFADFFRGRIFAIKRSLFTQILSTTDTTGAATSSSSFVDFTPLDTTIVPTQPNSPIIVLTTAPSYTQQNDSGFTSAIRNETDATNYREDSGGREAERGGIGSLDINLANSFMAHFEERTTSTEYRYQYRTVGVGPVAVGRNEDDDGGEHSEMIVWEFLNSGTPSVPITQTCIDDDQILTGVLVADDGTFNTGLTISGVPVSTGTGGGGAGGDFVARTGDSMTGNLDMAGNNVYNAGTVAMQDDTPVLTTSGLLWFDTDATGHGEHGSASLPGGMIAATLTSSSGIAIPDSSLKGDIPWDTVNIDNGGWYDAAFPQRLTVPTGVLYAQVYANVNFDAENSVNRRQIRIYRNGDTDNNVAEDNQQSILNATFYPTLRAESAVLTVSGGDYFELSSNINTNGGPLDILASGTNFGALAIDTRGIPGVNSINLLQGDVNVTPGSGIAVNANSQTGEIEISLAQENRDLAIWSPDAPPASGTSFDSEWGDGAGTTGWTEWDVPSFLTASTLPKSGVLRLKAIGTVAGISGLIRTAPTSNFTIFTKLFMMQNTSEDFREFGVVLSDDLLGNPSTANFAVVSVPFHEDGTDAQAYYFGFATQHFTDYNSFDRNLHFSGVQFPANDPIYVKVHVDVTTRVVSTAASRDGLIWGQEITSDFSGDLSAITEMGYWIGNNTSAGPLTITSDFFRVVESIDHSAPLRGDFLTVSGVPQAIVVATGTQGGGGSGDGTITDINLQPGPSVTISGAGSVEVTTATNFITVSGSSAGSITDVNAQAGPSITITGTAGIGVVTAGNVITIDGTDVLGASGSTISGCYTHTQSSASDTWNVTHNLESVPVNYIVLDNSSVEVIPDTFTVNDGNSVTITFAFPQAGTADIFPCISGTGSPAGETEGTATISGCYSHVQSAGSDAWTVNHGLATEMVNYILIDGSGSQFQPDDFTVVDPNQVTFDFVSNRTGIANIFACTSGTVTFQGGHFSNIVAVTGTFTEGITVGTGTTFITGEGIDTPELKIAGETPNFGAEFSGYYLNPQAKPAVVHSASDWFDDNSGNPTLTGTHTIDTGKWTLWDVDTVAHASNGRTDPMFDGSVPPIEFDTNNIRVLHDGSTTGGWLGYFQAAPAGAFTITARVSIRRSIFDGSAGGEENTMGIFIAEDLSSSPGTKELVSMGLHWDDAPPTTSEWARYQAAEWTDYNSIGPFNEIAGEVRENLWVRLTYRTSDDRVLHSYSIDGITWSELRRTTPIGFTVGSIGFGLQSAKTYTSTGKIDLFAVASGTGNDRCYGHGRLIPLPV